MKYLIILFGDESKYESLSEDEMAADMQGHVEFGTWCEQNGVNILGGEALQDTHTAKSIRSNGDVTDGPYMELKEQIGGYYVIETDSAELALQAAQKCPNYGANELRLIAEM